jgi:transposase-like protein
MDFPILEITDDARAEQWLRKYFHPNGLQCPGCGATVQGALLCGQTRRSHVTQHRCRHCRKMYTVYAGTMFANKHLRPTQVILLLRGICKGEPTASLARELQLAYDTVPPVREQIQAHAIHLQPNTPLLDVVTETDEMFQSMMATAISGSP